MRSDGQLKRRLREGDRKSEVRAVVEDQVNKGSAGYERAGEGLALRRQQDDC